MTEVSFAKRLKQHIDSYLRGLLTGVHGGSPSSDSVEELLRHFTVAMTPLQVRFAFRRRVRIAESSIINEAEPCLNRKDIPSHSPNRRRLTELIERANVTLDDDDPALDDEPPSSPSSPPGLLDRGFRQVLALMRTGPWRPTVADADSAALPGDDANEAHDGAAPNSPRSAGSAESSGTTSPSGIPA